MTPNPRHGGVLLRLDHHRLVGQLHEELNQLHLCCFCLFSGFSPKQLREHRAPKLSSQTTPLAKSLELMRILNYRTPTRVDGGLGEREEKSDETDKPRQQISPSDKERNSLARQRRDTRAQLACVSSTI